ncbi:hypothetical protein N0V95_003281 [Ascochyta clinopodiicola]|nr:hypothetical protein N0V95_003281 [Ascochyta clinopodiicola]
MGQLVDDLNDAACDSQAASASGTMDSIIDNILLLVYISVALFFLTYTHIVCWNLVSQRLAQRIRDRYLRSLLRQDVLSFDHRQAGEVSSRLNGDIQAIESGTCEKVGIFLTCVSFCVTAYIIAFIKDYELAAMLLSLIPAYLLMAIVGGHYVQKYTANVSGYFSSASAIASEGLNHIGLVHALGASTKLEEKFKSHLSSARTQGIRKAVAAAIQGGTLYFIAYAGNALAYWQGSRKVASFIEAGTGGMTVGDTYTVIFILVDGAIVLSQVAPLLPIFGGAVAAFNRLRKEIDQEPSIDSMSSAGDKPSEVNGAIELRHVSFTYPSRPEHSVLRDVSLQCEAEKLTAIVGLSGSGKSTIAGLLTRFYDPNTGSVMLDGTDIKCLNVKGLRGLIGLVPQEPSLLPRSILENVALGLVNAQAHSRLQRILLSDALSLLAERVRSGEDMTKCAEKAGPEVCEIIQLVQNATRLADAANFIDRLESGLATSVGSSGDLLSGGQKQRIALARALVRDPKILILDEATAALDSASELRIQAAINKASHGRTVISIAHRLSTIRDASKIIVMRQGEIIEQGTHDELIARDGSYADMIRLQSVKHSENAGPQSHTTEPDDDIDAILEQPQEVSRNDASGDDSAKTNDAPVEGHDCDIMSRSILPTLWPLVRPYVLLLMLAFFAATIVGGTYTASGLIFGNIMSSLSPCNQPDYIRSRGRLLSGMYFMLAVVEFFAHFLSWGAFGLLSERLLYKVRGLSLHTLLEQPLQWHESNNRSPSQLLEYITKDGNLLAGFSGSIAGTVFAVCVNFLAALILSHILNWRIAVVALVTVPLLLGSGFMQLRSISRFAQKHASAFSASIAVTVDAVHNIRTVAALSIEEEIIQTYHRSLEGPRKEMIIQCFKSNVWLAVANSTSGPIYALIYWWGSKLIFEGRATQTEFFIINVAMLVSAQLWGQLFTLAPEISKAKGAMGRICGVLELPDHISSDTLSEGSYNASTGFGDEKKDVEALSGTILSQPSHGGSAVEFRDITFSYPARPNIPVLNGLSFSIQPGQFCALVGPSGAGKSTVFALLERFYSPTSGAITMNGLDISRYHGTSFRDEIAYVPQANILFQGSIRFNLSLGARPGHSPTDDELHEACNLANIHETIMGFPQGYDTDCGANGSQLSGGQRQRLSIARALVRRPRLLLLDESTSALDAESEKALELGLEQAVRSQGMTVITIAHRLRTIAKADVIFLIEEGKVVDQGKHGDLVQRSESYRVNALHQML